MSECYGYEGSPKHLRRLDRLTAWKPHISKTYYGDHPWKCVGRKWTGIGANPAEAFRNWDDGQAGRPQREPHL